MKRNGLRITCPPAILLFLGCALLLGCEERLAMHDQPRLEPLEHSPFFEDGRASRPKIEGTIARGQLQLDAHFYKGLVENKPAKTFPIPVTHKLLQRGQERYAIYCSTCHGDLGNGQGMATLRGFKATPSFHIDRLRGAAPGYLFDVISNGFGAMNDYAMQITPEDRWAIVAYMRALQLSQYATVNEVPEEHRVSLNPMLENEKH